jgi:hypothetical protein
LNTFINVPFLLNSSLLFVTSPSEFPPGNSDSRVVHFAEPEPSCEGSVLDLLKGHGRRHGVYSGHGDDRGNADGFLGGYDPSKCYISRIRSDSTDAMGMSMGNRL